MRKKKKEEKGGGETHPNDFFSVIFANYEAIDFYSQASLCEGT